MPNRKFLFLVPAFLGAMILLSGLIESTVGAGQMAKPRVGTLEGAGFHNAEGTVKLTGHQLVMSNVAIDRVPDGRVYLANDADVQGGVELGRLTRFSGTVQYTIPSTINPDDYNSVLIWCKKFSVDIGYATLQDGQ
ncbi:MAG: DM13 domain-containing protein [Nitrospirota bacterium]|nr:DM13 domain-containing protein [Nitrospirota bacterium]